MSCLTAIVCYRLLSLLLFPLSLYKNKYPVYFFLRCVTKKKSAKHFPPDPFLKWFVKKTIRILLHIQISECSIIYSLKVRDLTQDDNFFDRTVICAVLQNLPRSLWIAPFDYLSSVEQNRSIKSSGHALLQYRYVQSTAFNVLANNEPQFPIGYYLKLPVMFILMCE